MNECNNKANTHNPKILVENDDAIRVLCTECKHQYILRKDNRGVPERRKYAKIYRRDVLQGNDNLLYKYHPEFLKT